MLRQRAGQLRAGQGGRSRDRGGFRPTPRRRGAAAQVASEHRLPRRRRQRTPPRARRRYPQQVPDERRTRLL